MINHVFPPTYQNIGAMLFFPPNEPNYMCHFTYIPIILPYFIMPSSTHRCCKDMIEVEPHVCSITRHYHVKGSLINDELPPDSAYKVCQKLYSRLHRKMNQNKQATSNQSPTPKR